jgi:proteasome lid subunit RPN8/RPN11
MKNKNQTKRTKTTQKPVPARKTSKSSQPVLRFSPTAWAKLLHFRDRSENEIGGFGITGPDDLLFIADFMTVKQEVTPVSIKFDDSAVADFFDDQVDAGKKPEQFARIWLHTHPGDSAEPSFIDEETFKKVFGNCQWAVMFVLAEDNQAYAKLRFNIGPGGHIRIPVEVNYNRQFGPSEPEKWDAEFEANIEPVTFTSFGEEDKHENELVTDLDRLNFPHEFIEGFDRMEPAEKRAVLDELAARTDLWDDEESEVFI